jgi:UPF0271 protein
VADGEDVIGEYYEGSPKKEGGSMADRIDLNCDLGESFGIYRIGRDTDVLDWITSANIACGFHAGDPHVMHRTVQLALEKGVAIGAHPGLPDRQWFGRRWMELTPEEVFDLVVYQVGALSAFVRVCGGELQHVKPHGALFNVAAVNSEIARAVAEAVARVDDHLILFGLAGSELVRAGRQVGLRVAEEVFADRQYEPDGTLTPRTRPDAVIHDPDHAVARVIRMIREGKVTAADGSDLGIRADTVCVHGDQPEAVAFVRQLRQAFEANGIQVKRVGEL